MSRTCSDMDIWSSGPRMATLPAMVDASVSKITLLKQGCISSGCATGHLCRSASSAACVDVCHM